MVKVESEHGYWIKFWVDGHYSHSARLDCHHDGSWSATLFNNHDTAEPTGLMLEAGFEAKTLSKMIETLEGHAIKYAKKFGLTLPETKKKLEEYPWGKSKGKIWNGR